MRWAFGLFGGVFLLFSAILGYLSYDFYFHSDAVHGTVVEIEINSGSDSTSYRPKVRFLDANGRKWVGTTFLSSSGYNFDIGERVDIRYDRRDPTSIRMDNWLELWGFSAIIAFPGAVIVLIVLLVGSGRRRQTTAKPAPKSRQEKPDRIKSGQAMDNVGKPAIKPRPMDRQSTVRRRR